MGVFAHHDDRFNCTKLGEESYEQLAVAIVVPDGAIEYYNPGFSRLTGYQSGNSLP